MLRGIVYHQLDSFLLEQVTFQYIHPDVFQPQLKDKAGIGGITSFNFGHLGLPQFLELHGCSLKAMAKVFFKQIFCGSRWINRPWLDMGTWEAPICEVCSTGCPTGISDMIGADVAISAIWTHLWGVVGTSASARISSKVSLFMISFPSKSGTWPVFKASPLLVLTVPGR